MATTLAFIRFKPTAQRLVDNELNHIAFVSDGIGVALHILDYIGPPALLQAKLLAQSPVST